MMGVREQLTDSQFWQLVNDRLRSIAGTLEATFDNLSGTLLVSGRTPYCEDKDIQLESWHHVAEVAQLYDFPSRALVLVALQEANKKDVVTWTFVWHQFDGEQASPEMVLFERAPGGPHNERGYTEDELASRITVLEAAGLPVPRYYRLALSHFRDKGTEAVGSEPFEGW